MDSNYKLSDKDISNIIGPSQCEVVTYPQLSKYKSINQMFANKPVKVILYVNEKTGNTLSGHWTIATKNGNRVDYLDSYGGLPDEPMVEWYSDQHKEETGQDVNYLSRMCHKFIKEGGSVHYNNKQLQKFSPDINTCGRYCALFGRNYKIGVEKFDKILRKEAKGNGIGLDGYVTQLSNYIMDKSIV